MCIAFPSPIALHVSHIYIILYSHREIASWLMFLFVLLYRYEINILLYYYYYYYYYYTNSSVTFGMRLVCGAHTCRVLKLPEPCVTRREDVTFREVSSSPWGATIISIPLGCYMFHEASVSLSV